VTPDTFRNHFWSWAEDVDEVEVRRAHAQTVVGSNITRVRYFTLDYSRWEMAADLHGPRTIQCQEEWETPSWARPGFDTLDWGLEIEFAEGEVFSVTWDPPGNHEGIRICNVPIASSTLVEDTPTAIWDVSERSRWKDFIGKSIDSITLNYFPWNRQGGFWSTRITIEIADSKIHFLLACGKGEDDPAIYPSANDVVVIFPPTELPQWELNRIGPIQ
jgi:hypothetical protein